MLQVPDIKLSAVLRTKDEYEELQQKLEFFLQERHDLPTWEAWANLPLTSELTWGHAVLFLYPEYRDTRGQLPTRDQLIQSFLYGTH